MVQLVLLSNGFLFVFSTLLAGWQRQYENDLYKILKDKGSSLTETEMKGLILGGETAMWSEQVCVWGCSIPWYDESKRQASFGG